MANTGNKVYLTLTYDNGVDPLQSFDIPEDATAADIVTITGELVTISQSQNWIDNRLIPCEDEPDCSDCKTCLDPLPVNTYYADLTINNRAESGFLTINGVEECWELVIS